MLLAPTVEVRAMSLIVLPVSAQLLLSAWAGAFVLLTPRPVEPAMRWGGIPMLLLFRGLLLASPVTLFNTRISVDRDGITILLPYEGSIAYRRDELDVSMRHRIIRLKEKSATTSSSAVNECTAITSSDHDQSLPRL